MGEPEAGGAYRVPRTPGPGPEAGDLRALLDEVVRTRAAQHAQQSERGATAQTMLPARRACLRALENYAVALHLHGWPLPPKMRLEIQLLRPLCGSMSRPDAAGAAPRSRG